MNIERPTSNVEHRTDASLRSSHVFNRDWYDHRLIHHDSLVGWAELVKPNIKDNWGGDVIGTKHNAYPLLGFAALSPT